MRHATSRRRSACSPIDFEDFQSLPPALRRKVSPNSTYSRLLPMPSSNSSLEPGMYCPCPQLKREECSTFPVWVAICITQELTMALGGRCQPTFLAAGPHRPPLLGLGHLEIRALRAPLNSSLCRRTPGLGAAARSSSGRRACISSLWTLKTLAGLTCHACLGQFWARRRPSTVTPTVLFRPLASESIAYSARPTS